MCCSEKEQSYGMSILQLQEKNREIVKQLDRVNEELNRVNVHSTNKEGTLSYSENA